MPDGLTLLLVICLLIAILQLVLGGFGPRDVWIGKRKIRVKGSATAFVLFAVAALVIGYVMGMVADENNSVKNALSAKYPSLVIRVYKDGHGADLVDPNRAKKLTCSVTVAKTAQDHNAIILGGLSDDCRSMILTAAASK